MADRAYAPIRILALAGMEGCWIYGFLLLFHHRVCGECLPLAGILCFGPAAFLLAFILRSSKWGRALRHPILWSCWLIAAVLFTGFALYGSLPVAGLPWLRLLPARVFSIDLFPTPELLTLSGAALLWAFGQRLAGLAEDGSILMSEFQFGLFMLLILLLLDGRLSLHLPGLLPLTAGFFLFALTGLAVNLLHEGPDWLSSGRRALWLGVALGAVCLVLGAGLIAVRLMSPELMNDVAAFLEEVWNFTSYWVSRILLFIASLFPAPGPQQFNMPLTPQPGGEHDPSIIVKLFRFPEWLRKLGSFIVAGIWIFLFVGALWTLSLSLFRWFLRRMAQSEDAEVEPLSGALREDLLLLARLLALKIGKLYDGLLRLFGKRARRSAPPATLRILYRKLLRWGAHRGFPRRPAQTPGEYLETLVQRAPGARGEISFLTSQYVIDRYGPTPVDAGLVAEMEAKWRAVRRTKIVKAEIRDQESEKIASSEQ